MGLFSGKDVKYAGDGIKAAGEGVTSVLSGVRTLITGDMPAETVERLREIELEVMKVGQNIQAGQQAIEKAAIEKGGFSSLFLSGWRPALGWISAAAIVNAIKTLTDKLETALEDDGASGYQYTDLALENAPTGSGSSDVTSINGVEVTGPDDFKADVSSIPTDPLLTSDSRLDNLDATVSSRSTLTASDVWAHVVGLTTTAGTALNKLICRLVHNTTASGTQFYEDDNTTPHDSVTISENDRAVDTE